MVTLRTGRVTVENTAEGGRMKVVVVGGTGMVGSKVVSTLTQRGHGVVSASPDTGVDTVTGEGLSEVLEDASAVIDVSNSRSLEGQAALDFFTRSTGNLVNAEATAGVRHHVVLSVVGTERLTESGYFRAKLAQERLVEGSPVPYSLVRATQFFEFVQPIASVATEEDTVRLPPVLFQPMAAADVASALAEIATGEPLDSTVEVAGPEEFRLDALVRHALRVWGDPRHVVADPRATYFGAHVQERALVPREGPRLGRVRFDDWLRRSAVPA
jgi:uncharacterized protein YbjT (DUF2867 family)